MREAMKQQFGLLKRPWGVFYLKNKVTGEQTTLKTRDKDEAQRLLQARNESESQPHFSLALARVYMNGSDPKLGTRTWQEVMAHIVERKIDETRRRQGSSFHLSVPLWLTTNSPRPIRIRGCQAEDSGICRRSN
jgi:hypothetical protein